MAECGSPVCHPGERVITHCIDSYSRIKHGAKLRYTQGLPDRLVLRLAAAYRLALADLNERLLGVRTIDCEPGLKRILDHLSATDQAWQSSPLPMALSADILRNPKEATHFDGFASAATILLAAGLRRSIRNSCRALWPVPSADILTDFPADRGWLRLGFISFTQRIGLNGTAHVDGTLLTGTDPRDAVVDANGAVFGISGLYVVDGGILPRSSRVNPSLSIYAWGLRVADLLAKSLRPPGKAQAQP